ncbi:MAG: iron complex transport system ATP-binding protein, partial [Thermomicrobiales bacterium]|nr:iron complex transport system ATP-binding protein [Thermomicrobiales bacterium]
RFPVNDGHDPVLAIEDAKVWVEDGTPILNGVSWTVRRGEHWALLGPNGSGKSTLLSLVGAVRHPSEGSVTVLGGRLGKVSLWELRERIGVIDPALKILDWLTVEEVVLTGATGTIWPQPDRIGEAEHLRARELLDLLGCAGLAGREITTCSQGERQRVRIARALMAEPPLLLLDEPATGLDLPAREALLAALATLASSRPDLATILVSHHLEELPPTTTHALLLRDGATVATGPAHETLTTANVSTAFGFPVTVLHDAGRWTARAVANWHTRD